MGVDMSWTKRRKHLSRAARAALRIKAEQEKIREPVVEVATAVPRSVPRRRDVECLVAQANRQCSIGWPDNYRNLLAEVLARRPGLVDDPYRGGLLALTYAEWLRDPADWRPKGRGLGAAYRSLAEHLLGVYRVSCFLWDTLLFSRGWPDWDRDTVQFVAGVARGVSPRRMVGTDLLPLPLTRRMVHLAVNPPRTMPYPAMVRRAQVLGYGGSPALADALCNSWLARFRPDEPYWATVIHWLCRQDGLNRSVLTSVFDYLSEMQLDREPVSMQGRSLRAVLRDAARWLREFERPEPPKRRHVNLAALSSCAAATPIPSCIGPYASGDWAIEPIRTARKLMIEGYAMRHCVGIYGSDLKSGDRGFWSLTCKGRRQLTIEVDNVKRTTLCIAGRTNRKPREKEMEHIRAWVAAAGVAVDERWLRV